MKKILSFIVMMVILVTTVAVYATATVTMRLTSDKTTLTAGDEITLTFSIGSITDIEGGIKAIQGTIEYDTNIFEEITTSSKVDMNGWATELNTANNMFAGTSSGATGGSIFTLTLKVKEGISATNTTVTIKDIKTADPTNDDEKVDVANVSVTIGSTIITPINNTVNNTSNTNGVNRNNVVNVNADNTTSSSVLPQTGISPYVIIAIVVIAVVAVVSIVRYKNIIK